jgi:hypothetical protein
MPAGADEDSRSRALAAAGDVLERMHGRVLTLARLEEAVARAAPDVGAGVPRRELLATTVRTLVDAGGIELPRTPSCWLEGTPRLPRWVTRVGGRRPARRRVRTGHPWRPELMWARETALTDDQFEALKAVQEWIRTRPRDDPRASVRERSVDVFGDDMRIEALAGGALFAPGRLTFDMLDCAPGAPPLATCDLDGGDAGDGRSDWLVVENASTFRSLAAFPGAIPGVSVLVFGAGAQAPAGLPALLEQHRGAPPRRVRWFGDVDRDGLRFAIAAELALLGAGVPVLPDHALYRALVQRGCTAPSRAPAVDEQEAARLASWLRDPHLEAFAVEVLTSGRRAMQEQVGPRQLRRLGA